MTVTSANSCSTFKTKTINVPLPPTLDFSRSNLCTGKDAVFTDLTPPQQDAVVGWNWNFDGNSVAGNPAQYNFANAGTYAAKMTTTHTSGCKYTVSKNVLINTSPVASFTATPDRGAAPLAVQFTNTSQGGTSNSWKFYDKTTATSTQASPAYTFLALGDYSAELTVTNAQGCFDVKAVPIKVLVPSVDLVLSDFSLTPDPTTGKLKGVVTILNNSNVPVTSAEVALILANNGVVNETFAVNLNPGQSVVKTLSFTVSPNQFDFNFLCAEIISEKDIQKDNNRRCVNLEKSDYFFNPYPNPTSGKLEVDWITVTAGSAAITIYDSMGKKTYAFETLSKAGLNQVVFDLTFLSSGLYYLTIETPGSKKTTRFFRE
ncbi:MAG: PKD domain-containing protein [Bacteroidota bacterium]